MMFFDGDKEEEELEEGAGEELDGVTDEEEM